MFKNGCIYLKSKDADLISITNGVIVTKERRYVLILMVWTLKVFRCGAFKCIRMYCSIKYDSSMV